MAESRWQLPLKWRRQRAPVGRRTLARRHDARRLGAALLVAAASFLAIRTVAPPAPATVTVAVATRSLPAGAHVGAGDVESAAMPEQWAPPGRLTVGSATDRVLAGPVDAGEVLTSSRLLPDNGLPPGHGALWVPVADPANSRTITPGQRVDLYQPGQTAPVVTDVAVLPTDEPAPAADSLLGADPNAARLLIAVTPDQAGVVALASGSDVAAPFLVLAHR